MSTPHLRSARGFTLIELLITITILAIISSIGVAVYRNARTNGNDARLKSDVDAIASAYENTYNPIAGVYSSIKTGSAFSNGNYPTQPNGSDYTYSDGPDSTSNPSHSQSYKVCAVLSDNSSYCRTNQQGSASGATGPLTCAKFPTGVASQSCKVWSNAVPASVSTIYINCSDIGTGTGLPMDCSKTASWPYPNWPVGNYYTQAVGGTATSLNQNTSGQPANIWENDNPDPGQKSVTVSLHQ